MRVDGGFKRALGAGCRAAGAVRLLGAPLNAPNARPPPSPALAGDLYTRLSADLRQLPPGAGAGGKLRAWAAPRGRAARELVLTLPPGPTTPAVEAAVATLVGACPGLEEVVVSCPADGSDGGGGLHTLPAGLAAATSLARLTLSAERFDAPLPGGRCGGRFAALGGWEGEGLLSSCAPPPPRPTLSPTTPTFQTGLAASPA